MEYIKKEELIEGKIYTHANGNIFRCDQINNTTICGKYINITYNVFKKPPENPGNFWINEIRLATSEEKHWLNTCIEQDKFITFEEAMKTFIPEYVECVRNMLVFKLNGVFKTEIYSYGGYRVLCHSSGGQDIKGFENCFKPSTKEAYDAQFVAREPKFVLPEKWCIKCNESNYELIKKWANYFWWYSDFDRIITSNKTWSKNFNGSLKDYTEITFEQFKKYVLKEETVVEEVEIIEPLPQFKVIETIETITKVENNEGNQFFIGDIVKSSNGTVQTIESFDYNKAKTNIIAFTNKQPKLSNGIGIDKIEHYIEPKTNYQILEYKTEGGISCRAPFLTDSHQFYINERCKIHSIKRISDDLTITVDDEVLSKTCGVPNKILSIELINNKIRLYPRNSFYSLEDILKINNK